MSPTAVRELLKAEGFAPLPRRLDEERPDYPRPTVEAVADIREFSLEPRAFSTRCGGLFLFVPDLVRLNTDRLAAAGRLPGSNMIPAEHALRASLALKLWSIERKSHIMALVSDEGLALFSGLNAIPKKSYLSEISYTKALCKNYELKFGNAQRTLNDFKVKKIQSRRQLKRVPNYSPEFVNYPIRSKRVRVELTADEHAALEQLKENGWGKTDGEALRSAFFSWYHRNRRPMPLRGRVRQN